MERVVHSDFDDEKVCTILFDYLVARFDLKKPHHFRVLDGFLIDDPSYKKRADYGVFDGFLVKWNSFYGSYERFALMEVKVRSEEYDSPLIECLKIESWLKHNEKWKHLWYYNVFPSGVYVLKVENLKLWEYKREKDGVVSYDWWKVGKDFTEDVKYNGDFDRKKSRSSGVSLNSDTDKRVLFVPLDLYWVKICSLSECGLDYLFTEKENE